MTPILHALHTGTLAAWLSAGTLATVGLVMPEWVGRPKLPEAPVTQVVWVEPDLHPSPPGPEPAAADAEATVSDALPAPAPEPLPAPPEMPEMVDTPPLPDLPELPPEPPRAASPGTSAAAPVARPRPAVGGNRPSGPARSSAPGSAASGANQGGGGEMSMASRISAGRMPGPSYPSESRRKGQTGTVVVEFTVGNNGRVMAARAVSPSPWPLLNEAAVRAVRSWRFPPGPVMTLRRPIDFQLR
ncbi:MAG: energy transducer TonB [Akkermansiaceae bacterium]|nr:energy transducer TonB [Akkermansiaceae bacterium]